ncbi:TniB family NTP-binding protein [Granulicella sp. S190]|uniref:TniB family NTP-binding protein n=1 Tax=Granulicella sp. S190 TaxID=1747226 RepID=UPI00131C0BD2|nr:TniB family NTP-binding protein [Granulicella sp. S190]
MFDPHTFLNVTIPHAASTEITERIELLAAARDKREDPYCIALTGPTGAGKTFTLNALYEKNCAYDTTEGMVHPWIKVKVPSVPTLKNMAASILTVLDPGDSGTRSTESQITHRITALLEECETDVIWLDDFQHLYDRHNEKFFYEASNWLKNLIETRKKNRTKRMLIVSGLDDAMKVINHNSQLRRRFRAKLSLPCFSWSDVKQRTEFAACQQEFLNHLESQFTLEDLRSASFIFRCYCATGGLIGYLKRLLQEVVLSADGCKKSTIGIEDFDLAYDRYLCDSPELQNIDYRPFSKEFDPTPTDELLALALLISMPPDRPVATVRKRSPRTLGRSFVEAGLSAT